MIDFNYDAYFVSNTTHKPCEDFAFVNQNNDIKACAISDGCSSSYFTDFGSRILIMELFKYMNENIINDTEITKDFLYKIFQETFYNSKNLVETYNLPIESLDATLGFLLQHNDKIYLCFWGDGFINIHYNNGPIISKKIYFTENMPDFLRYFFTDEQEYFLYQNKKLLKVNDNEPYEIKKGLYFEEFDCKDIQNLSMTSDGIEKFFDKENFDFIDETELLSSLTSFNNSNGKFVKRKLTKQYNKCRNSNIEIYDDLSMCSFVRI